MNKVKWAIVILIVMLLSACDSGQIFHRLRPNSVVIAFGDSLTFGTGAGPDSSYPAQLSQLIARRNIVNAGVPGELSAEGVRRLPAILDEHNPDLVILCHGGNDLLQKLNKQQLKENLRRMFEMVNQRGIPMVMVAVPEPTLLMNDADIYAELAEELNIPLVKGVLGKLLRSGKYKSDPGHLNAEGYRKLAEAIADLLMELRVV